MMVGRTIYEGAPELPENAGTDVVMEVRHLNRGRAVRDVSFKLQRGEILGFAGLVGAGRTEVARAIFGADSAVGRRYWCMASKYISTVPATPCAPASAICPEDRKRYGLALGMDVETNIGAGDACSISQAARLASTSRRRARRPTTMCKACRSRRLACSRRSRTCRAATSRRSLSEMAAPPTPTS